MGRKNRYQCFDDFAQRLIRKKAHQLGATGAEDRQDVEQELALHLWKAQQRDDRARLTSQPFLRTAVTNKVANIAEARAAKKRQTTQRPPGKLAASGEALPGEVVDISDMLAVEGRRQRQDDLHIAVQRAMAQVYGEEHELCRRLMEDTISEVAKDTGTPRSTLYSSMARIRHHFERAGLRHYLASDTFRASPVRTGRRR